MSRWIDLFDEEDVIHKRVDYLKDRHWIDKQTKEVSFSIFVLNAQEEPLVAETKLSFEFTRGAKHAANHCGEPPRIPRNFP